MGRVEPASAEMRTAATAEVERAGDTTATRTRARRRGSVRRQVVAIAGLLVIAGVAVAGWIAGTRVQSPDAAAARAAPPPASLITAPVELRVLSSRVVTRGDVVAGQSLTVAGPAIEEAVVTAVFLEVGDPVADGDRILEVSGRPVIVFEGSVPAYRAMEPGMSGTDIGQLQEALSRVNCDTSADGAVYGEATKQCVARLYEVYGYDIVPTSADEAEKLAEASTRVADAEETLTNAQVALEEAAKGPDRSDVITAEQAVAAASRKVDADAANGAAARADAAAAVDAAVMALNAQLANRQSTPTDRAKALADLETAVTAEAKAKREAVEADVAAAEALAAAEADLADLMDPPDVDTQQAAVDQAQSALERARETLTDLEARSGPTVPLGEVVFVDELPATVNTLNATVGVGVGESGNNDPFSPNQNQGAGLAQLATAALQVETFVPPADAELIEVGMEVELMNDSVSSDVVAGELTSLGEQVESRGERRGLRALIEAPDAIPRSWTGANVRVTFTAAATAGDVLVVPIAALSSGGDGNARVEVVNDDGTVTPVAVDAGLEAEGFVSVEPLEAGALQEGALVVVGNE